MPIKRPKSRFVSFVSFQLTASDDRLGRGGMWAQMLDRGWLSFRRTSEAHFRTVLQKPTKMMVEKRSVEEKRENE
jgi:hypothetical protein